MSPGRRRFLRDLGAGPLLDAMLLSAVLSVLAIRFWLHVTGYPKIGGDALHIAHMLWGGLLMLAALVILAAFLDRRARQVAAVLGGLGFGVFIDEVGKFLTHDNDYFYQPAVSIMYVVFLLLYAVGRRLTRSGGATREEYLLNALHEMGEVAVGDLDPWERDRALGHLQASGDRGPLAAGLHGILARADLVAGPRPGALRRGLDALVAAYRHVATRPWFGWFLVVFFAIQLAGKVVRLGAMVFWSAPAPAALLRIPLFNELPDDPADYALAHWLQLLGGVLSGVFVALGLAKVFHDRLAALRHFHRSVLVSLGLTQVFVFYRVEWLGLGELVLNLLILAALRFAIAREERWAD